MVEDSQAPARAYTLLRGLVIRLVHNCPGVAGICAPEADVPPAAEGRDGTWSLKGAGWVLWGICPPPPSPSGSRPWMPWRKSSLRLSCEGWMLSEPPVLCSERG